MGDTLKEYLRKFEGKTIGVKVIKDGVEAVLGGVVTVGEDEGVYLVRDRQLVEGPPQAGPAGLVRQQMFFPLIHIYIGDALLMEHVVAIEVPQESEAEAEKQLKAEKPMIATPKMAVPGGMPPSTGFIPGR